MPANTLQVRAYRQALKRRAFKLLGFHCIFCGCTRRKRKKTKTGTRAICMHAAHVVPTGLNGAGRGLDRRYRDIIKNPDKYRLMCEDCHRIFDALIKLINPPNEEPIP